MPETTLSTAHAVLTAAGEPPATILVKNLLSTTHAAWDAWGRPSKHQPMLITARVSFAEPFPTSASTDQLSADTVHYGTLSKCILSSVEQQTKPYPLTGGDGSTRNPFILIHSIWDALTGGCAWTGLHSYKHDDKHLLGGVMERITFLGVEVTFPKASLLGSGVTIGASAAPGGGVYNFFMRLNEVRVPTLIGVNANEREAKQVVSATVTLDGIDAPTDGHNYVDLERTVVKVMEESEFETLEALANYIADKVLKEFPENLQVHVKLEKPTAVTFADCPVIEVRRRSE
ncbi:hypothetical protein OQA88_3701 [Cercophora sp. LCS_1]